MEGTKIIMISVIIPIYNAEQYIETALDSVFRQSFSDFEVICVDDGSTDKSLAMVRDYQKKVETGKLVVLTQNNKGPAAARNRGIRAAKGRYLAYLDADDYWERDKLKRQLSFQIETKAAFTFTGYEFADSQGQRKGTVVHVPEQIGYKEAISNTTISTITVMLDRTQIPERLLLMPETLSREDSATWWQILRSGYTAYGLDEPLSVYRRHRGSHSANKLKAVAGTYRMYRKQERFGVAKSLYCMARYIAGAMKRRLPQKAPGKG